MNRRTTEALRAPRHILVVRRHNQIGDMLCSQPLYAALKRRWPAASITLLAAPTNYPIPYRDLVPWLDDVWTYERSLPASLRSLRARFRSRRFDIVVVPSTIRLSVSCHLFARMSGAPVRAGVRSIDGRRNAAHPLLTLKRRYAWAGEHVHQTQRNLDIARLLGCDVTAADAAAMTLPVTAAHAAAATAVLAALPAAPGSAIVGMHPGSGSEHRRWSAGRFIDTARLLHAGSPVHVLITTGAIDDVAAAEVEAGLRAAGIPCTRLGRRPLLEEAAVMQLLDVYISNDTGPMHIAAAAGARLVSLHLPGMDWEWGPRTPSSIALVSPTNAIDDLPPAAVAEACRRLMLPGA